MHVDGFFDDSPRLSTSPNNCIRMIRMKGSEKLVKKAVAPAIRKGSFFLSRMNAFCSICHPPSRPVFFVHAAKYDP